MKKIILLVMTAVTAFTLIAEPRKSGITPEDIIAAVPSIAEKTIDELTISEHIAIAAEISVEMQKSSYIYRAAMSSFTIPGIGQFKTGETLPGILHLTAQVAITGGTIAGLYFLLPEDLKQFDLTKEERHDLFRSYMTSERIGLILPAAGVAAGGFILSTVNSVIASKSAAKSAQANIDSGKITFKPYLTAGSMFGFGMKW